MVAAAVVAAAEGSRGGRIPRRGRDDERAVGRRRRERAIANGSTGPNAAALSTRVAFFSAISLCRTGESGSMTLCTSMLAESALRSVVAPLEESEGASSYHAFFGSAPRKRSRKRETRRER